MKKRVFIIVIALFVIAFGGFMAWRFWVRALPLNQIVLMENWTLVSAQYHAGLDTQDPIQPMDPDSLAQLLAPVMVRRSAAIHALDPPYLMFWLQSETAEMFELVICKDGKLTYALLSDLQGTRTYWEVDDPELFQNILEILPQ